MLRHLAPALCVLALAHAPAAAQDFRLSDLRLAALSQSNTADYELSGTFHHRRALPDTATLRVHLSSQADFADTARVLRYCLRPYAGAGQPMGCQFPLPLDNVDTIYIRLELDSHVVWGPAALAVPPRAPPVPAAAAPAARHLGLNQFLLTSLSIVIAGLPFLFLGAVASALIEVFVPPERLARIFPARGVRSILAALFLGLLLPVCECGIVPVVRRLFRKGVPPFLCMLFLLSDPVVNLATVLSTGTAFGFGSFVFWGRVLLGPLIALAVASVIALVAHGRYLLPEVAHECGCGQDHGHDRADTCACGHDHGEASEPALDRFLAIVADEFLEFLTYVTVGALLTATIRLAVPTELLARFSAGPLAVPALMLLAVLLSICSSADAFVAVAYSAFPPGAVLAFLLVGPILDLKLLLIYSFTFRRRVIVALAVSAFTLVCLVGWACGLAVSP